MRCYGDKPPAFMAKVPGGLLPVIEIDGQVCLCGKGMGGRDLQLACAPSASNCQHTKTCLQRGLMRLLALPEQSRHCYKMLHGYNAGPLYSLECDHQFTHGVKRTGIAVKSGLLRRGGLDSPS
eukprot:350975-Chlamydomonas_euryale.AAC.3